MKTIEQLAQELIDNPPDFEGMYGTGTSGEKIAQNTWVAAINSLRARYQHEQPTEVANEADAGRHPSQRSTE